MVHKIIGFSVIHQSRGSLTDLPCQRLKIIGNFYKPQNNHKLLGNSLPDFFVSILDIMKN